MRPISWKAWCLCGGSRVATRSQVSRTNIEPDSPGARVPDEATCTTRLARTSSVGNEFSARAHPRAQHHQHHLREKLEEENILIRDGSSFPGLGRRYFRIAVRTRSDNQRLIDGLRTISCSPGIKQVRARHRSTHHVQGDRLLRL
jgi:hypothetical protein